MSTIRNALVSDAALIRRLIWELAEFEKEPEKVRTTESEGEPAGFALFFPYYSTWRGAGLYLEDLYVRPAFRGRGIGTQLLARVARIAQQEKRCFIKWSG